MRVQALIAVAFGLIGNYGCAKELRDWWRSRRRLVRVQGVVVGHRQAHGRHPSWRPILRFWAHDGRLVDAVSSFQSRPAIKLGRTVNVTYDAADPESTAEIGRVRRVKLVLMPVLMLVFTAILVAGLNQMLAGD